MNIEYSKQFIKDAKALSGKYKESLAKVVSEFKAIDSFDELTDCKKITGLNHSYRIRMGSYRILCLLAIVNETIHLQRIVSRGEAYNKGNIDLLKNKEKTL